jgi:hypothetical protein
MQLIASAHTTNEDFTKTSGDKMALINAQPILLFSLVLFRKICDPFDPKYKSGRLLVALGCIITIIIVHH